MMLGDLDADASGRMLWRGNGTFAALGVTPGVDLDR
jgi:hypothetical protein